MTPADNFWTRRIVERIVDLSNLLSAARIDKDTMMRTATSLHNACILSQLLVHDFSKWKAHSLPLLPPYHSIRYSVPVTTPVPSELESLVISSKIDETWTSEPDTRADEEFPSSGQPLCQSPALCEESPSKPRCRRQ